MWAYNVSFKNQRPPKKKPKIWHKRRLMRERKSGIRVIQRCPRDSQTMKTIAIVLVCPHRWKVSSYC